MRRASAATRRAPHRRRPILVLAAAAAATLVAGASVRHLVVSLPPVRLARLSHESYERLAAGANGALSRTARQGLICTNLSHLFTAALREPKVIDQNRQTIHRMLAELRDTQFGRVQLAAFTLLELEQGGVPIEEWAAQVDPLLTGLERASFPHFLNEVIDNRATIYTAGGLAAGSAGIIAEVAVDHPHGPLLQFAADRLRRVARQRSAQQPDAYDVVLQRVLREWALEPGPLGLRLLAADLLERHASGTAVAAELQTWRAAQRNALADAAAARTPLDAAVELGNVPLVRAPETSRLRGQLWQSAWIAALTAFVGLVSLILLVVGRDVGPSEPGGRRRRWGAAGAALAACLAIGGLLAAWQPAQTDLARSFHQDAGWTWLPAAALGFALLVTLLVLAGVPGVPWRTRLARAGGVLAHLWLALAVVAGGLSWLGTRNLAGYERDLAAAHRAQRAGRGPDDGLPLLRQWDPAAGIMP